MRVKTFWLFLFTVSCSSWLSAQDKPDQLLTFDEPFKFKLTPLVLSEYVIQNGAVIHDHPVAQTDLYLTLPWGFYLNPWWSVGLDDRNLNSNEGDEIDLSFGWTGKLFSFGLNIGVSYFDIVPLEKMPRGDLVLPYGEINRSFNPLERLEITPYVMLVGLFPTKGDEPEGGTRIFWGFRDTIKLFDFLDFENDSSLLWEDGALGFDPGLVGRFEALLSWKPFKSEKIGFSILAPLVRLYSPLTRVDDGREFEIVYGGGLKLTF